MVCASIAGWQPRTPRPFLHNHRQLDDLIRIVAEEQSIAPALVEKDYWIMQSLYGLQQLGLTFELKGGTSLSKGCGLISRFSEDPETRARLQKTYIASSALYFRGQPAFDDLLAEIARTSRRL